MNSAAEVDGEAITVRFHKLDQVDNVVERATTEMQRLCLHDQSCQGKVQLGILEHGQGDMVVRKELADEVDHDSVEGGHPLRLLLDRAIVFLRTLLGAAGVGTVPTEVLGR